MTGRRPSLGPQADAARRLVRSVLGDPRAASRFGLACLEALPERPASAAALTGTILGADGMTGREPAAAADRVRSRIRADFAQGAIMSVEGWLLSATEARLYALAALAA
jgi:hypothetical protein